MSKKYKGKPCSYCAEGISSTGDHVFAREFFLEADREYLPKVPACSVCNRRKSELEHYLTTLLPFGARHEAAEANLRHMVPKRLSRNAKLHRQLLEDIAHWGSERDRGILGSTLTIDPNIVMRLFEFVVKGLAVYHWNVHLTRNVEVQVMAIPEARRRFFDDLLRWKAADRVKVDLGHGTFVYEGAKGMDCEQLTVWRIEIYGGLQFMDSQSGTISSCIGAWSRPLPG